MILLLLLLLYLFGRKTPSPHIYIYIFVLFPAFFFVFFFFFKKISCGINATGEEKVKIFLGGEWGLLEKGGENCIQQKGTVQKKN